jgi:tetratricopeptide (TPR) repeat protein/transcriptional regulator with XRE-family HTH domain
VGSGWPAPDFGTLLRQLRTSAGLTQEELADSATLSPRTVSDLERGVNVTARAPTARLLAGALSLTGSARSEFLAAAKGLWATDLAAFPAGARMHGRESQNRTLPRDSSVFTGRADEFARTLNVIADAGARGGVIGICAIGGMAGVGKTTLAVHAAHALAPRFPDGQIFVPLHGHTPGQRPVDAAEALAGLLLAAGFDAGRIPAERDARERCWRDYLADRKVLLVLDDATGYDHVRPLLPGTGQSTALITSRQRLTALDDATVISLDTLPRSDAATLVVRLSRRPGLHIDDPVVIELAGLCGDLPLAIGMLARQLHHHPAWSPASLAAELAAARDRLDLMSTENVSVAAAFDLSYRNLAAGQRRLFRRLGLHPGPDINKYTAAALADVSVTVASRQLGVLYDQHLLTEPAVGRYRLHDLLRQHARTLAAADSSQICEAAISRLLDYYAHTAAAAAKHIPVWTTATKLPAPPGHPPAHQPPVTSHERATDWMEAERANLYAVVSYAAETSRPAHVITLSAAMAGFLEARGPWDKAIAQHEAAAAAAAQAGDKAGQAGALNQLSSIQAMSGDARAVANLERVKALYRELGDLGGLADAMNGQATLVTSLGDYQQAGDLAREALRLYTQIGHRRGQADAISALAVLQAAAGDYRAALAGHRQALQILTDLNDRWGQTLREVDLGILQRLTGDHAEAELTQRQALRTCRDYHDRYVEAFITNELGVLRRLAGDYDAAAAILSRALELHRDIGHVDGIAIASNDLGLLWQLTGDYQAAMTNHLEALAICTDYALPPLRAWVLNSLGELCTRTGQCAHARDYHTQALRIARDLPEPREEGRALEGIGRSYLKDNEPAKAQPPLTQAFEIYERIGILEAREVRETLSDANARRH